MRPRLGIALLVWTAGVVASMALASAQEPPASADALFLEAQQALRAGDLARAGELHQRVLALREAEPAPDDLAIAKSLEALSRVSNERGDFPRARAYLERARDILERHGDRELARLLGVESSLAKLDFDEGDYSAAKARLERALARAEATPGFDPSTLGRLAGNLGAALHRGGEAGDARGLYQRAIRVYEAAHGPTHSILLQPLSNLGALLHTLGDHAEARRVYERGLEIAEHVSPPDLTAQANLLHNTAFLLQDMGDRAAARRLAEQALALNQRIYGPDHHVPAYTMDLLGLIVDKLGAHQEAVDFAEKAAATAERSLGPEHVQVAEHLLSLGRAETRAGRVASAVAHLERGLTLRERTVGGEHPDLAPLLEALAEAHAAAGRVDLALPLARRALETRRRQLSPRHPETALSLGLLARLQARIGRVEEALDLALQAEDVAREHFRLTVRTLGERQALLYAEARAGGLDLALTVLAGRPSAAPERARLALDALVRSRALVLDELSRRRRAVARAAGREATALVDRWSRARERLAFLAVRGPAGEEPARYRKLLAVAEAEKDASESALAEVSAAWRDERAQDQAGLQTVLAALPARAALVAYARFTPPEGVGPPAYLAFVAGGASSPARAIPLGPAAPIERAVQAVQRELRQEGVSAGRSRRRNLASYRRAAGELRRAVWDPVERELGAASTAYLVPDGALHLVNFAALPVGGDSYLVERRVTLHVVSAERDLLSRDRAPGQGLLALGDPDYSAPPDALRAAAETTGNLRGSWMDCQAARSLRFRDLPLFAAELNEVASLWKRHAPSAETVLLRRGPEATEAAFKLGAPGRRVVHLATHGFFIDRACDPVPAPLAGGPEGGMLRSGLALAGANRHASATADAQDGILTAEEVAALDLDGVEWAVLSACETGVGDVRTGEGVFGLRRAFQIAGARALILSLWPVADEPALRFMQALYRARLAGGRHAAEAVRAASLEVLRERRARGLSPHPFYWAAFIAAGDDR